MSVDNTLVEVSECEVIETWIDLELQKRSKDRGEFPDLSGLDLLLNLESDSASIFQDYSYDWYLTELAEEQLRCLRHVWSDAGLSGTVMDLAQEIDDNNPSPGLEANRGKIRDIKEIASNVPDSIKGKLILSERDERGKLYVADGNHRATALALHLSRTGTYQPVPVYVGFRDRFGLDHLSLCRWLKKSVRGRRR